MAKLVVLYDPPEDPEAFDAYYRQTHVPIAKQLPGLVRFDVSDGPIVDPTGASPYALIATLEFASMADLKAALRSPQGKATAADVPNFAKSGVRMLIFDTTTV